MKASALAILCAVSIPCAFAGDGRDEGRRPAQDPHQYEKQAGSKSNKPATSQAGPGRLANHGGKGKDSEGTSGTPSFAEENNASKPTNSSATTNTTPSFSEVNNASTPTNYDTGNSVDTSNATDSSNQGGSFEEQNNQSQPTNPAAKPAEDGGGAVTSGAGLTAKPKLHLGSDAGGQWGLDGGSGATNTGGDLRQDPGRGGDDFGEDTGTGGASGNVDASKMHKPKTDDDRHAAHAEKKKK